MSKKIIPDERIVTALLAAGTVKGAADSLGITERCVYARMQTDAFREIMMSARADIVRTAVNALNGHLFEAIETAAGIMNDSSVNSAIRLQAAGMIINTACKFTDRLGGNEAALRVQHDDNMFNGSVL